MVWDVGNVCLLNSTTMRDTTLITSSEVFLMHDEYSIYNY